MKYVSIKKTSVVPRCVMCKKSAAGVVFNRASNQEEALCEKCFNINQEIELSKNLVPTGKLFLMEGDK